ncbi:MAG: glycosyltransferase [Paracoccus denitrificans]|nr:MAG: glycosyltransferase [Paracoccus denitrificans]PZO85598.1 MAG: glycosyltransferase [Paracoccus denitrificans]
MKQPSIVAVVVTHNRLAKLRLTLARLIGQPIDHILVFDNASTDGTKEWLLGQASANLTVTLSAENLGGAGGFAAAMREARDIHDPDWLVVMDDDGRPAEGAIAEFLAMDLTKWDAIGAAVFHPDGRICEMNRPYRNPFWRGREFLRTLAGKGRGGFHLSDDAYVPTSQTVEVDMASFVGLFVSRAALTDTDLPDPRLFIYGDDQIFTLNLRKKGFRLGFAPAVRFEHDTDAQQGETGLVLRPMWKVYYNYRNALIAYRVAAGWLFWPLVPLLLVKWHRKARDYGEDAKVFRQLLGGAVRDGLSHALDRSHTEVVSMSTRN